MVLHLLKYYAGFNNDNTLFQVEESLSIFDVDGEGWISRGQIKHLMCSQTGEELTEEEFEELLDNIPGNEDGMIRVADFAHLLCQGDLPKVTDL